MILHAKISSSFDSNGLKEYEVLPGAVFTMTYNEELDSGTIVITHVSEEDRLENLNPYDWVRVYDSATPHKLDKLYLVDNYVEKQINILEPYYEYTIELMSETKLLEKIQLPNRQWQHSLTVAGTTRKTIYQIIHELFELYVPKIKEYSSTDPRGFTYEPLIMESQDLEDKFDVPCKDISLSQPTFRQCLTALMTQVGCIPMVQNGELTYLDLRAEPQSMVLNADSFNQVQRSASSDSFVNQIVNQGENILDTDNKTVSEVLGFRDRSKVFLKQEENLFLETRYPIYKVTKLVMNDKAIAKVNITQRNEWHPADGDFELSIYPALAITDPKARLRYQSTSSVTLKDQKAVYYKRTLVSSGYAYQISRIVDVSNVTYSASPGSYTTEYQDLQGWQNGESAVTIISTLSYNGTDYTMFSFGSINGSNTNIYIPFLITYDITPLCVEESKRQLLDTDFLTMTESNIQSMSDLAQYYYGTVGYQIGGKTIEGWSSTYQYTPSGSWWEAVTTGGIQRTVTYIENIENKIIENIDPTDYLTTQLISKEIFGDQDFLSDGEWSTDGTVLGYGSLDYNFARWFFNLEYQPLNSLCVKYTKQGDVPIPYEQLDNPDSAISSMDALSLHEKDMVERLGNPVMSINQYAADEYYGQLKWFNGRPLKYQNHTVFQIVYSFDFNGTGANYFASKDFIIKNYNTAIMTKYRAYQYIDYSQAITRKENDKIYVLVSKTNYYDMDEKVTFGTLGDEAQVAQSKAGLMSPFRYAAPAPLVMGYQSAYPDFTIDTYKNEMSAITYGSSIILNQEDFDNVSPGLKLVNKTGYSNDLGGYPQDWYMWSSGTFYRKTYGWMSDISSAYNDIVLPDEYIAMASNLPGINFTLAPLFEDSRLPNLQTISLVMKDYYKDFGEIINQSLQFEYYSDDGSIEFGAFFADAISWKDQDGWVKKIIVDQTFYNNHIEMSDAEYEGDASAFGDFYDYVTGSGMSFIVSLDRFGLNPVIGKDGLPVIRCVLTKSVNGTLMFRDCWEITYPEDEPEQVTYYVRLNDTKTQKVFAIDQETRIPYLKYDVNHL